MTTRTTPAREATKRRSGVQSVEVGAAVLRALADAPGPLPLGEISRSAKMSPGKTHRYLVSFVEAGLAIQSGATGDYDLGPLAARLGLAAIGRFDVVRIAGERLHELRDAVDATSFVALWTDAGPSVARIALSAHPVTLAVRIGTTFPVWETATGRIFVGFGERAAVLPLCSSANAAAADEFDAVRAAVRAAGVASADETFMVGVRALSAPLFHPDGRLAAVLTVIGGPNAFSLTADSPVAAALTGFAGAVQRGGIG